MPPPKKIELFESIFIRLTNGTLLPIIGVFNLLLFNIEYLIL